MSDLLEFIKMLWIVESVIFGTIFGALLLVNAVETWLLRREQAKHWRDEAWTELDRL
jgi:hypothetical protein